MNRPQSVNYLNWKKLYWRPYRRKLIMMDNYGKLKPSHYHKILKAWEGIEDY